MMTEKSFGKKALVNVVCNALGISTSRTEKDWNSNLVDEVKGIFCSKIPSIAELKKLKDWKKSLQSLPKCSVPWGESQQWWPRRKICVSRQT